MQKGMEGQREMNDSHGIRKASLDNTSPSNKNRFRSPI